jgi:Domain of unknown function (DUF5666)
MKNDQTTPTATEPKARRLLTKKRGWIAATALTSVLLIGLTGCAASTSAAPTASATPTSTAPAAGHGFPASGGGGSNARSGAAEGGSSGTVTSVSSTGFDVTSAAGQKVTVKTGSSTVYEDGTSATTASAVTTGASVLVLGMTSSTTITATQVIISPPASTGAPTYTTSAVVPFKQGSPSKANKDGNVPTDYTEGSGTIQTGATADKAATVALAAYPGGVVDRVVLLSDGEYEVHYIGVNWPHHIFVTAADQVVGAY